MKVVKSKKYSIIVDGSTVPEGNTSGVACLISPDIDTQIQYLSNKYNKWDTRDKNHACKVYEQQIGRQRGKVYIKGIKEEKSITSTEIERKALEYGNEIIKRNELEEYTLYTDC
jgi:hypothetical protein